MRRWHLWALSGPVAGGLTVGLLAPLLFVIDEVRVLRNLDSTILGVAAVAFLIAGAYGAAGGTVVGAVGAVAVAVLDHRRPSRSWWIDSAFGSAASGLATIGFSTLIVGGDASSGVVLWILVPALVTAAVAAAMAAAIFGACRPKTAPGSAASPAAAR